MSVQLQENLRIVLAKNSYSKYLKQFDLPELFVIELLDANFHSKVTETLGPDLNLEQHHLVKKQNEA